MVRQNDFVAYFICLEYSKGHHRFRQGLRVAQQKDQMKKLHQVNEANEAIRMAKQDWSASA